jgi:hypothetical protein
MACIVDQKGLVLASNGLVNRSGAAGLSTRPSMGADRAKEGECLTLDRYAAAAPTAPMDGFTRAAIRQQFASA